MPDPAPDPGIDALTAREREVLALLGEGRSNADARSRGFYDTAAIEADVRSGRWRDPTALWHALNLELWLRAPAAVPVAA